MILEIVGLGALFLLLKPKTNTTIDLPAPPSSGSGSGNGSGSGSGNGSGSGSGNGSGSGSGNGSGSGSGSSSNAYNNYVSNNYFMGNPNSCIANLQWNVPIKSANRCTISYFENVLGSFVPLAIRGNMDYTGVWNAELERVLKRVFSDDSRYTTDAARATLPTKTLMQLVQIANTTTANYTQTPIGKFKYWYAQQLDVSGRFFLNVLSLGFYNG